MAMTEVVTNTAASLQQAFAAERPQRAFNVSASQEDTSSKPNPILKPARAHSATAVARASKPDDAQAEGRKNKPQNAQTVRKQVDLSEVSRSETPVKSDAPKVEIKDFDVGRRAAEIVGTVDVVQRFDNNSDGRVDLLESQRAARARDSVFTYAARGVAKSDGPTVAEQVQRQEVEQSVAPAPNAQSGQPAQQAQPGSAAQQTPAPKKIFQDAQVVTGGPEEDGAVPKKLFGSAEAASTGTFSDGAPVEQKFYGDGIEVARGRFSSDPEVQQKLYDRAQESESGRFYEDGTGEQKLYDKVAQSEAGRFYQDPSERKLYDGEDVQTGSTEEGGEQEQTLYEKAQEVAARTETDVVADRQQKKLYSELELYADVAGYGEDVPVTVDINGNPITA
jgi:hypothetical protein